MRVHLHQGLPNQRIVNVFALLCVGDDLVCHAIAHENEGHFPWTLPLLVGGLVDRVSSNADLVPLRPGAPCAPQTSTSRRAESGQVPTARQAQRTESGRVLSFRALSVINVPWSVAGAVSELLARCCAGAARRRCKAPDVGMSLSMAPTVCVDGHLGQSTGPCGSALWADR